MKKFCITSLLLGLSLVIGGLFMIGTFASQGYDISDAFENESRRDNTEWSWSAETTMVVTGEYAETTESDSLYMYGDSYSHYYSSCDIKSIDIEASAADIFIVEGDQLSISGYGLDTNKFSEKITDDGKLRIEYKTDEDFLSSIADMTENKKASIDITVPAGYSLDEISADIDAGEISIIKQSAEELDIEMDAGDLQLTDTAVTDSSEINITAGNIYFYTSELTNTEIRSTAAKVFSTSLKLKGKTDIEITAGDINLMLSGTVDDYSYDISCSAGKLYINGSDKIPDTHGKDIIKINITAGDTDISFE